MLQGLVNNCGLHQLVRVQLLEVVQTVPTEHVRLHDLPLQLFRGVLTAQKLLYYFLEGLRGQLDPEGQFLIIFGDCVQQNEHVHNA